MYKQSRTLAANLRKKFRVENGDAVAVMMRNSPEYPTVVLGILAAGGIVTTFNPVYTSRKASNSIAPLHDAFIDLYYLFIKSEMLDNHFLNVCFYTEWVSRRFF